MPFLNEHSSQLQDPKKFEPKSFRRNDSDVFGKKLPAGVQVIWAKIKGKSAPNDPVIPQAIRFPEDKYTVVEAKKWLADNNIKFILFEPAKKETKESKFEVKIKEQTDDNLKESLRIIKTWYTELKKDDESECSESEVIDISKMVFREMIQRGKQKFHPENWKNEAIELYTKTFNAVIQEGIEIPENVMKFLPEKENKEEKKNKESINIDKNNNIDNMFFTLRKRWNDRDTDVRHELLIDTNKNSLDVWQLFGEAGKELLESDELSATKKTMNIQTPNRGDFREWMKWQGSIPSKKSKIEQVYVLKENGDGYIVRDRVGDQITTKPAKIKFKTGQSTWMDQHNNLFTGELGGPEYGNLTESSPSFVDIIDNGRIEIIEESKLFKSFRLFGGKMSGLWIMRKDNPETNVWIMSKGIDKKKIGESIDITDFTVIDVTTLTFPVEVKYKESSYKLTETKNGKLLLEK